MQTNFCKTENFCPVSRLGFGTASLASLDSRRKAWKLLDTALESGITHYDTARLYGNGLIERMISPFIRSNRNEITITTKFGLSGRWKGNVACSLIPPARRIAKCLLVPRGKSEMHIPSDKEAPWPTLTPELMRSSLETSLRELGVDHIDIFLMHEARSEQISDPLLEALENLRASGTITKYGSGGAWDHTTKLASLAWPYRPVIQAPAALYLMEYGLIDSTTKPDIIHSVFTGLPYLEQKLSIRKDAAMDYPGDEIIPNETLPRILLHWALNRYPKSMVLFGSRSAERIKNNVKHAKMVGETQEIQLQIDWLRRHISEILKASPHHL